MTLIELVKELRANGVVEYKGRFEGEEVFLKMLVANSDAPTGDKNKPIREPRGATGMTKAQQIELYGQFFPEDFVE